MIIIVAVPQKLGCLFFHTSWVFVHRKQPPRSACFIFYIPKTTKDGPPPLQDGSSDEEPLQLPVERDVANDTSSDGSSEGGFFFNDGQFFSLDPVWATLEHLLNTYPTQHNQTEMLEIFHTFKAGSWRPRQNLSITIAGILTHHPIEKCTVIEVFSPHPFEQSHRVYQIHRVESLGTYDRDETGWNFLDNSSRLELEKKILREKPDFLVMSPPVAVNFQATWSTLVTRYAHEQSRVAEKIAMIKWCMRMALHQQRRGAYYIFKAVDQNGYVA